MSLVDTNQWYDLFLEQPVTAQWQYQNQNGGWTLYDNDINDKIEKAFIRKPNGMYIVEIDRIM